MQIFLCRDSAGVQLVTSTSTKQNLLLKTIDNPVNNLKLVSNLANANLR